ncbi:hypothetical protein [Orrella marina]|uniref:hypothetical protein n=1 Tax=Orrella marina TaxID=2163011 RepID=UPI00131EDE9B|nr:hypothetical protein [Orrella marina]
MSLKGDVSGLRAQCASLAALREKEREESQLQKLKLEGRLEESQQAFASELSGLRAAMQLAEERSRSNEKRVLLELDRERMTATRLQKQLETVQSRSSQELKQSQEKLTQTHQELVESREKSGKLELQLELTRERLETTYRETLELRQSLSEVQDDARNAHASLREARQQQERQLQTDSGQRHKQAQRAMRRVVRGTRSESMRDRFDKRRDV